MDRWKDDGLKLERRAEGWIDGQMNEWAVERLKWLPEGRRTACVRNKTQSKYVSRFETNCLKLTSDCL